MDYGTREYSAWVLAHPGQAILTVVSDKLKTQRNIIIFQVFLLLVASAWNSGALKFNTILKILNVLSPYCKFVSHHLCEFATCKKNNSTPPLPVPPKSFNAFRTSRTCYINIDQHALSSWQVLSVTSFWIFNVSLPNFLSQLAGWWINFSTHELNKYLRIFNLFKYQIKSVNVKFCSHSSLKLSLIVTYWRVSVQQDPKKLSRTREKN